MSEGPRTWLETAQPQLQTLAGGFLRNARFINGVTCTYCTGMPGEGWAACRDCRGMMARDDLSDQLGFAAYAVKGQQSGYTMHGYKNPVPSDGHWATVKLLAGVTLHRHWNCLSTAEGGTPSHWATVPSLSGRTGAHPLETIVSPYLANLEQQPLMASSDVQTPRSVRPANFASAPLAGQHVLLLDDTWTRGGHVQSAAGALKVAGAGRVTTLVLARWIDPQWDNTAEVMREHLSSDYDSNVCPFTGGECAST